MEQLRPQRVGQVAVPESRPHQAPHARQHHGDRRRHDGEGAGDHRHARLRIAHVEEPQPQDRERDARGRGIHDGRGRKLARLGDERPDGDRRAPLERRGDRGGEGFAAGVARLGILGETAVDRLGQAVRDSRDERGHRRRRIGDVAGEHRHGVRPVERETTGQGEKPDHAERVQVAARIHRPTHRLLGAHELRRPHHPPRVGASAPVHARDTEVGDQRPAAPQLDQDVVRLHVAMHHAVRVSVVERSPDLLEHARDRRVAQRTIAAHALPQCLALHVRHGEEHEIAHLVHGEDRDDAGVPQLCRGPRLLQEALLGVGLEGAVGGEQLDGDPALEAHLPCQIDDTHAPVTEAPLQHVSPAKGPLEIRKEGVPRHRA